LFEAGFFAGSILTESGSGAMGVVRPSSRRTM
jgi:hypothetical protein